MGIGVIFVFSGKGGTAAGQRERTRLRNARNQPRAREGGEGGTGVIESGKVGGGADTIGLWELQQQTGCRPGQRIVQEMTAMLLQEGRSNCNGVSWVVRESRWDESREES